ncbi:MAG: cupin domain-containing protein [Chitinophagaceae bacterium]|nr:cupin domain-containing protein [Chitinophagaceae bacterium]MBP6590022.1 cupin domain-containing protein [Chitinophagaceae bacterium]MBP8242972.1 cupin domain-containing protein [Chitinophagaceae bacterium]
MEKINIADKLSQFSDYFNPRIAGELNGQQVKLVKFKGEFVWHHHEHEDELFYVIRGSFDMHLRSDNNPVSEEVITIFPGEFIIIPRGKEHKPVAKEEVEIMLFEPASTLNTGNQINEMTKKELKRI